MTEGLYFHFSLSCIGEGNANPLQCSCVENPRDREAWWAAISGVAQSRTRLKRLSSSSSIYYFIILFKMPTRKILSKSQCPLNQRGKISQGKEQIFSRVKKTGLLLRSTTFNPHIFSQTLCCSFFCLDTKVYELKR